MNPRHGKSMAAALRAGAALAVAPPVLAQPFPAKPVRIVVPYAAGGPGDTVARIAAQNLTGMLAPQAIPVSRCPRCTGVVTGEALHAASPTRGTPPEIRMLRKVTDTTHNVT